MVFRTDLQQRAHRWVHRRFPELLRVHLAKTLVAVDRDALLAGGEEVVDKFVDRGEGDVWLLRRLLWAFLRDVGGRQARDVFDRESALRSHGRCGWCVLDRFLLVSALRAGHDDDTVEHRHLAPGREEVAVLR